MSQPKKRALGETNALKYVGDMKQINSDLPDPIACYIDASNNFDAETASSSFAPDATVHDDEHDYIGIEAIKGWISDSISKYHAHASVTHVHHEGEKATLTVDVAGQFPGSPVELMFEFLIREGKIAHLTI